MHMTTTMTLVTAVMLLTANAGQAQVIEPGAVPVRGDTVDQLLSPPDAVPAAQPGEAYHRADDAQQDPGEVRTTQALNDEITSRNQLAENQERAEREAYEVAVTQATKERLAYEEAARQADAARRQWEIERDAAERARGQYAADLLACRAGDRTRCPR